MISKLAKIINNSYDKKEIEFALGKLNSIVTVEYTRKNQIKNEIRKKIANTRIKKGIILKLAELEKLEVYLNQVEKNIGKLENYIDILSRKQLFKKFYKDLH